jgi:hypothetical protein
VPCAKEMETEHEKDKKEEDEKESKVLDRYAKLWNDAE